MAPLWRHGGRAKGRLVAFHSGLKHIDFHVLERILRKNTVVGDVVTLDLVGMDRKHLLSNWPHAHW